MDMHYTTLGNTGLRVSVAGFGCGGNSRLGQGQNKSEADSVRLVKRALDLGINFFDTAQAYGTEEIVGKAISGHARSDVVISTKAQIVHAGTRLSAGEVIESLEGSLVRLQTDFVDIFHLHGVAPDDYQYACDVLAPALLAAKQEGKIRHLGITETAVRDTSHAMLHQATASDLWEVIMFAFHMLNQNARPQVFPAARARGIGTLLMFVVRNIFSQPAYLKEAVETLVSRGALDRNTVDVDDPLGFLVHEGGAESIVDAAYRFARHEPGTDVVLFGTGSVDHLESNVGSILRPALPEKDVDRLYELFGALEGIGLDAPDRMQASG
ncbi:MAG: L-galactose dehydrogenase [Gammaproteobacteria bacterium]|jgi:L-galactose dehydrogenase